MTAMPHNKSRKDYGGPEDAARGKRNTVTATFHAINGSLRRNPTTDEAERELAAAYRHAGMTPPRSLRSRTLT